MNIDLRGGSFCPSPKLGAVALLSLGAAIASACANRNDGKLGVAYLHIYDRAGPCNPTLSSGVLQFPTTPDFRRARATASFSAASSWAGGNLIVMAWKDADGTVGRLYVDLSPTRGFGTSIIPDTNVPHVPQSLGLVFWNGATRTFAAQKVVATIIYDGTQSSANPEPPGTLYVGAAFDGVGPKGEALCEFVGVHADATVARSDSYDPTWLTANPTVMISNGPPGGVPTLSGDQAPTVALVGPSAAPSDPGGKAPDMQIHSFTALGAGGADPCD